MSFLLKGLSVVGRIVGSITSIIPNINWIARETNRNWITCASSSNGMNLVAAVSNGQIYTSTP